MRLSWLGNLTLLFILIASFPLMALDYVEVEEEPEEIVDIPTYTGRFGVRGSVGYSLPLLDLDFDSQGIFNNADFNVFQDSIDEHNGSIAASLGFKYSPLEYFAVGISLDYNITPLERVELSANGGTINNLFFVGDIGDLHMLSGFGFIEFRVPFKVTAGVVAPYVQGGLGVTGLIADFNSRLLRLNTEVTIGMFAAGGLEVILDKSQQLGIFAEARWHYSFTDVNLRPTLNSSFQGDLTLGNIYFLAGVNFYFG